MDPLHITLCLLMLSAPADVDSATPSPETLFHTARMEAYYGEDAAALRDVRRFLDIYADHPLGVDLALWAVRYLDETERHAEARSLLEWLDTKSIPHIFQGEAALLRSQSEGATDLSEVDTGDPLAGREALAALLAKARKSGTVDDTVRDQLEEFVRYYPDDRRAAEYAGWAWDDLIATGRVGEAQDLYRELSRHDGFPVDSSWNELTDLASLAETGSLHAVIARTSAILNRIPAGPRRALLAREMAHVLSGTGSFLALVGQLGKIVGQGRMDTEEFSTLVELVEAAADSEEDVEVIRKSLPMRDLHHLLLVAHARDGKLDSFDEWTEKTMTRWPKDPMTYELPAALMARRGKHARVNDYLLRGLRSVEDERLREEFEAALEGVRSATDLVPLSVPAQ